MSKKYASLTTLQTFLNNLKNLFATKEEIDSKADATHNHNDIYYTETEVDEKLATKSDSSHNHDSVYDLKGSANTALDTAKEYTDTKTSSLASTTVVDTKISTHNASTSAHNDIRALITDLTTKLNNFLDVDDTTTDQLSEVLTLIENNKGTLESLTTSKINVSDIVNNLTTNSTGKVLSAAQGVEIKSLIDALQIEIDNLGTEFDTHGHEISDIANLQDELDVLADGKSDTNHTHLYAGSATAGGAATSAEKLTTARKISLGTGVSSTATSFNGTSNITIPVTGIKESYLEYGGKNIVGGVTPLDVATSNLHAANRFAFAYHDGITVEYSQDGGSTWTDYSTAFTNQVDYYTGKIKLVSGIGYVFKIGGRNNSNTADDKLRITLDATAMGVYTSLQKLLIEVTTFNAKGSNVFIEKAMKGSDTTFSTVGTYELSGWSGWNSIPIRSGFGGGNDQTWNMAKLRLTFGITGTNGEATANDLTVHNIVAIGQTYWSTPSAMAKTGHIYTYDANQNATFPAKVTASSFEGNATSATKDGAGNIITDTYVQYVSNNNVSVGGTTKPVYRLQPPNTDGNGTASSGSAYFPEGIIMGGSALTAGLMTRGICGITTADAYTGACNKENLYLNYDGSNTYKSDRQVVLQASEVGAHYGNNIYQYAAVRGDALKNYCDNLYYDKTTIDEKVDTINETYETKSDATAKLNEAKTYADNAADTVKNDLLGNAGGAYDTLKELGDLIDTNHDAIEALETVASGKADKTHIHTEATTSESGFLSAENKTQLNNGGSPIVITSGTGAAYTATVSGITTLTAGIHFIMIPHTVSTAAAPTLNVNGLGAKSIRRRTTQATTSTATGYAASWLSANKPIRVEYDGTFWIADLPKPSASDLSGTLGVSNGGTGKSSVTSGNYLVGNGTSAMTEKTPAQVLSDIGAAPAYTYSTTDLTAGSSTLTTGKLYFVYE